MDPTNPGNQWPMSAALVEDAFDFIESMVKAIYKSVI
jgi:hypothetical protein